MYIQRPFTIKHMYPLDPWATGELIWVWLLCSPERLTSTHRHTGTHSCRKCTIMRPTAARLSMQMKICDYGIQCKSLSPPPPFPLWQICIICITCSTCWLGEESEASRARLSSRSKQPVMLHISRAFRHQCPGLETSFFFLHRLPLYLITLEEKEYNSTFPGEQSWPGMK